MRWEAEFGLGGKTKAGISRLSMFPETGGVPVFFLLLILVVFCLEAWIGPYFILLVITDAWVSPDIVATVGRKKSRHRDFPVSGVAAAFGLAPILTIDFDRDWRFRR